MSVLITMYVSPLEIIVHRVSVHLILAYSIFKVPPFATSCSTIIRGISRELDRYTLKRRRYTIRKYIEEVGFNIEYSIFADRMQSEC
jgi:hypothetical protein